MHYLDSACGDPGFDHDCFHGVGDRDKCIHAVTVLQPHLLGRECDAASDDEANFAFAE
jgi:hypothetical protein